MPRFMSKILYLSTTLLFAVNLLLSAQYSNGNISVNSSSYGTLSFDDSPAWNKTFITDRPVNTNLLVGNPFVDADWQIGDIVVIENKSEIAGVPVRIDAKFNLIEINVDGVVKVLHSSNTYSLALRTSKEVFVSNKTLGIAEPEGFYKVVYNKKSSLLCHYSTKVVPGSYNAVLDAGIKEDKMLVEQTYYLFKDGKLTRLEKNRKKLIKQFNDQPNITEFIKEQRITPKYEEDLVKLIGFIDSAG